jgi:uncharacterized protein YoxC
MTQTAALIAAISFALLALAGIIALLRLAKFMSEGTRLLARGEVLLDRAQAAVDRAQAAVDKADAAADRAHSQLDKTESVTASMDELGAGVAELTTQVTAVAGFGRALAGGPGGRAGALADGVRHALSLRRAERLNRTLPGSVVDRNRTSAAATSTLERR